MAHLLCFRDTGPHVARPQIPENAIPASLEPPKSINAADKTVLVVADECLVQFLRRCFQEDGYTIRHAATAEEGMRLYSDFAPFNVVIIDYDTQQRNGLQINPTLPQTSGRKLASDILKINSSQGIIFAASAYQSRDDLSLPQELLHIPVLIDISICQLRTLLSTVEARRAIAGLTTADKLRLRAAASYWIRGLGRAARNRTPDDLLHEAQLRTLTGERNWKSSIDFVRHLNKVMQSIADSWQKKRGEKETCLFTEIVSVDAEGQESSPLQTVASPEAAADQILIANEEVNRAEEEVDRIFKMFSNDTESTQVEATHILQGLKDGLKPREIRQQYGLDEQRFAAAMKRIRVKIMSGRDRKDGVKGHGKQDK